MAKRLANKEIIVQTIVYNVCSVNESDEYIEGKEVYFEIEDITHIETFGKAVARNGKWELEQIGYLIKYKYRGVIRKVICEYLIPELEELYQLKFKK